MIVSLLVLTSLLQQQPAAPVTQATPAKEAAAVISKTLARYFDAERVVGRIKLTQTAGSVTVMGETQLQYERPSKIYLSQVLQTSERPTFLLVSDGKIFSYNKPANVLGRDRLVEYVTQNGRSQSIKDIYLVAGPTLVDRSPVLDIAIGRREDLQEITRRWRNLRIKERLKVRDAQVTVVEGDFHSIPGSAATGSFELAVTEEGDLVRYVQKERISVPQTSTGILEVLSIWDADLKHGGEAKPELYRVPR